MPNISTQMQLEALVKQAQKKFASVNDADNKAKQEVINMMLLYIREFCSLFLSESELQNLEKREENIPPKNPKITAYFEQFEYKEDEPFIQLALAKHFIEEIAKVHSPKILATENNKAIMNEILEEKFEFEENQQIFLQTELKQNLSSAFRTPIVVGCAAAMILGICTLFFNLPLGLIVIGGALAIIAATLSLDHMITKPQKQKETKKDAMVGMKCAISGMYNFIFSATNPRPLEPHHQPLRSEGPPTINP